MANIAKKIIIAIAETAIFGVKLTTAILKLIMESINKNMLPAVNSPLFLALISIILGLVSFKLCSPLIARHLVFR